jgi:TRAP-type C4-dicarboxylate transport system substrate-binding protein
MENDSIGFLKERMKVVELGGAERAEFRKAAQPVWDWLVHQYPAEKENLENIVAELARIEAETK